MIDWLVSSIPGIRRYPRNSTINTIVAVAGVVALTLAASEANQKLLEVKDYNGNVTAYMTSSGGLVMSGTTAIKTLTQPDCDVLATGSGQLYCGTNGSGGSGNGDVTGTGASTNVAYWTGQKTLSGASFITIDYANRTEEIHGTLSGANIHGQDSLTTSGSFIVEGLTTLHGNVEMDGGNINDVGDITFKTGAQGGTVRTGTSNADKYQLQGYDVDDGVYRNVFEVDAGNDVTFEFNNDAANIDLRAEGVNDPNLLFLDASLDFVGIGTSTPETKLEVIGTISGASIRAQDDLTSSGTLVIEGNAFFNSTITSTLTNCDFINSNAAGAFGCGVEYSEDRFVLYGANSRIAVGSGMTFYAAFSGSLVDARAFLEEAGSGITIDVLNDGVSMLSTLLTTDDNERTSDTAATAVAINSSTSRFTQTNALTFELSGTGAVAGTGLTLLLNYQVDSW